MAHAAKNKTAAFGLLEHSMKRLTAPGRGSYDERQARFDAATPACKPRDVMCAIENLEGFVTLLVSKALSASSFTVRRPESFLRFAERRRRSISKRSYWEFCRTIEPQKPEGRIEAFIPRRRLSGIRSTGQRKAVVDRFATEDRASYKGPPPASRQPAAKTIDTEPSAQGPRSTPSSISDRESAAPPRACAGRRRNSIRSLFAPPSARRRRSR
jgi:hypothetical protein